MKKTKQEVEKLKSDILDVAEEIFRTKNYSEVNIKDISEKLGVTRTPIYYHFKTKYEIYFQVMERYLRKKVEIFRDVLLGNETYYEKVRADLSLCTKYALFESILFSEIQTNPELSEIFEMRKAATKQIYEFKIAAIKKGIERKELAENTDAEELTANLYLLHFGVIEMRRRTWEDFTDKMIDRLVEMQIQNIRSNYGVKEREECR